MSRLFGTDGIRGVAYKEPMTVRTATAVGHAVARAFVRPKRKTAIVIGRDTRQSGKTLERAVAAGAIAAGAEVLLAGVIPTPAVAFLARTAGAAAGIVISASHNPYRDNGIKVFSGNGYKLPVKTEKKIEAFVKAALAGRITAAGRPAAIPGAAARYVDYCITVASSPLKGLRVVLDCSNGATSAVAPEVFRRLGATVSVMNDRPNGKNINANCGSEHPERLAAAVRKLRASAGFAFDGDGDRLIAVDERGNILSGDHIMAICARQLKKERRLANNLLVVTAMSNLGLHVAMKKIGVRCIEAGVGDREVLELMKKEGAVLGGEQSGHMILLDRHTTGDGLVSALQLADVLVTTGQSLSRQASFMKLFPQALINVEVASKPALETCVGITGAIANAERVLAGRGRILVRYSGTQSICRVMVEGPATRLTEQLAGKIAAAVRADLG